VAHGSGTPRRRDALVLQVGGLMTPDFDSATMRAAEKRTETGSRPGTRRAVRPAPRPDLSGCRLARPGWPDIYLVEPAGYRRRILNQATYDRLFRDWSGIIDVLDLENIAERAPLDANTMLIQGDADETIYLLDGHVRRALTHRSVMEKYWFNWDRVSLVRQRLVEQVPLGEPWE
jgi:hypothetical protein